MNILITGGAGFIGSHTSIVLSEAGHKVIIYDNFCNSNQSILTRIQKIVGKPVSCINGDILNTALLVETLTQFKVDVVIHFAGLKAVGESIEDPLNCYENNVVGTMSLLKAMSACKIKKIVFSSSATVYGDPEYLPIDECHPIRPTNPYGQTKAQSEQILKDLAQSDSEWRVVCLRYFNPIGAHDSGLIGEDPSGTPNNLMPYITQVASGKLTNLDIFRGDYGTNDGTGVRDYIHVVDLAEGHLAALEYLENFFGWDVFNLGTGHGSSVKELIKAFNDATGANIPYKLVEKRQGDVASSYASEIKAMQKLKWISRRLIGDACSSMWKFQNKKIND